MFGKENRKPGGPDLLHSEKIVTERKVFFLDLKENDRGQFVKITEDVRGHRDTILVPAEYLDDFIEALQRIAEESDNLSEED
ncbi:MAG: DNA-binding protein [Verrucomicrobiota bacterium]